MLPVVDGKPYVLGGPNRGYELVPKKSYDGTARQWTPGHVSGWEGVEMEWRIPKQAGYKGFETGTYVLTNESHFHAADELTKQIREAQLFSRWQQEPIFSDATTYIKAGDNEIYRARVALVALQDIKAQYELATVQQRGIWHTIVDRSLDTPEWMNVEIPANPQLAAQVLEENAVNLNPHLLLEDTGELGAGLPGMC